MSNALLTVTFPDGFKLYSQYHGSCDRAYPALFSTPQEAWSFSRYDKSGSQRLEESKDPIQPEPVNIHSDYGGGFSWQGIACRKAPVLISPLEPDETEVDDDPE